MTGAPRIHDVTSDPGCLCRVGPPPAPNSACRVRMPGLDSMAACHHAVTMKRTQIQLDPDTYAAVRREAYETGRSISAVVRETLASAFDIKTLPARTLADFRFVGAGRARAPRGAPASEAHDEALADAFAGRRRRR